MNIYISMVFFSLSGMKIDPSRSGCSTRSSNRAGMPHSDQEISKLSTNSRKQGSVNPPEDITSTTEVKDTDIGTIPESFL